MPPKKTRKTLRAYNRIREVLDEKGMTQSWLAGELDKDFKTVTRYVNNHRQPTIATLFEIAAILNVSPRDLLNE